MVQVDHGWAPVTAEAGPIEGAVRAHLETALAELGGGRLQLIRRPDVQSGVVVMAARCDGEAGVLYRRNLPHLDALLDVDIAALFSGGEDAERVEESVFLVCTHGVRDRCCSRLGTPVYKALSERCKTQVWQTTHLGGHRFAATLVVLPEGLQFGRVQPGEVGALIDGLARDEIYRLDRFRGRVALPRMAQVAEAHVRQAQKVTSISAVRCVSQEDGLVCTVDGVPLDVRITATPHPEARPYSCGSDALKRPMVYATPSLD